MDSAFASNPRLWVAAEQVGRHVEELEDVRLTAHDGQLYIQFVGMMRRFEEDGSPIPLRLEGRQWLARLERVKASEVRRHNLRSAPCKFPYSAWYSVTRKKARFRAIIDCYRSADHVWRGISGAHRLASALHVH